MFEVYKVQYKLTRCTHCYYSCNLHVASSLISCCHAQYYDHNDRHANGDLGMASAIDT